MCLINNNDDKLFTLAKLSFEKQFNVKLNITNIKLNEENFANEIDCNLIVHELLNFKNIFYNAIFYIKKVGKENKIYSKIGIKNNDIFLDTRYYIFEKKNKTWIEE